MNARLQMYAAGLELCDISTFLFHGIRKGMPSHFRNLCGAVLGRKFINSFLKYFFDGEDVKCSCVNGNEGTPLPQMFPLARRNDVAHIVFAYTSANVEFGMDSYDFHQEKY
ncbi:predicted protein [Chaetoceros tenuissimus]|uniref:Uncharacterized protein n=1 Tax=Chaetoceros tenuissimus TaxID=426638 RepID=A0AAD3D8G7_9STRA|nr:predicted protein [Chaetoceros tenuissimus]